MKTIILNRHAKSSWKNLNITDFDRPLNKRGRVNAKFMAKLFSEENQQVDRLISSPAKRAFHTAKFFAKAMGIEKQEILKERDIYHAGVWDMLRTIENLDEHYQTVMFFGHNPTFTDLAHHFDHRFSSHLVTCARVRIEFDLESWSMLGSDTGRVVEHIYPRMYAQMEHL